MHDATQTSDEQIVVSWSALTTDAERGGPSTSVTSYNLQWDNGSGGVSWEALVGISPPSLQTTHTQTAGIVPGRLYQLRVRAKNKFGWGVESSPAIEVYAAAKPEVPVAPTSAKGTAAEDDTTMRISLTEPDTNGLPITAYEVRIKQKDGTFSATTACDGSTTGVIDDQYCNVEMITLRQAPYALELNDPVIAIVKATNLIGSTAFSVETPLASAGLIATEPRAPPNPPSRGANTDDTQLHVTWPALTGDDTGGETIIHYDVEWYTAETGWQYFAYESSAGGFTYSKI